MDLLEEPTREVIEEYRRRFNDPLDIPVHDLSFEQRGRFVAALERALRRNIALLDFEREEFMVSWRRRTWLAMKRQVAHLVRRQPS